MKGALGNIMQQAQQMQEDMQKAQAELENIAAAINDAVRKVAKIKKEKMGDVTAGMPIPPGFKMPF